MQAALQKVGADLKVASAELEALRLIGPQLQRFEEEMAKDSSLQRQVAGQVVAGVQKKSDAFVDRTLQLSNSATLLSYLLDGGGSSGSSRRRKTLPEQDAAGSFVYRNFLTDVMGGSYEQLRTLVQEHTGWLAANCKQQLGYYERFVAARARALGDSVRASATARGAAAEGSSDDEAGSSSSNGGAPPRVASQGEPSGGGSSLAASGAAAAQQGESSKALAAVAEFNPRGAAALLDQEVKEVVLGTASTAVGGPGVGLLAANTLGDTFADLLALSLGSVASYVAVINLPLRRAELKAKVNKVAGNFSERVQAEMAAELQAGVAALRGDILALAAPLEQEYSAEVERLSGQQAALTALEAQLEELSKRTASL